ncbi:MAG: hypothetical protein WD768_20435 [Phycisphaeraceae bacterium]
MWNDPIVEEVRRAREKILEECGFDLRKLMERLQAEHRHYGDRLVSPDEVRLRRRKRESETANEA